MNNTVPIEHGEFVGQPVEVPAMRVAGVPEEVLAALHRDVMNLPCKVPPGYPFGSELCAGVYRQGHRDARHAAAELVCAALAASSAAPGPIDIKLLQEIEGEFVRLEDLPAFIRRLQDEVREARQRPAAQAASAEPLDMPLPCDIKIGGGTIGKGCTLRTLVLRMEAIHRAAFGDEAQAIKLLRSVAPFTNGEGEIVRFLRDHDQLVTMLGGSVATPPGERPAEPAQAPWKAISDAIRKVTGHPDLTSGSLSLLAEIIRALAQASPASDAWRCACGSALYIDAEGKPRSKAADGVEVSRELQLEQALICLVATLRDYGTFPPKVLPALKLAERVLDAPGVKGGA
jgi:hypothetical protein